MNRRHSEHYAALVKRCLDTGTTFDVTPEAELVWLDVLADKAMKDDIFLRECTPGYYNNEGKVQRNSIWRGRPRGDAVCGSYRRRSPFTMDAREHRRLRRVANDFVSAATNLQSFQVTLTRPATIAGAIWMQFPTRRIGILRLTQIGRTALAKRRTNCRRRPLWRLRALAGYSKPVDFCGADAVALADYRQPDKRHFAEKLPLNGSVKGIVAMDSVDGS